jgi:peptidoglycan/xylan/chitin deacetylase (PgdA/CDA1 family)
LNDFTIREETASSKKILENVLQNKVTLFSYPHGMFNERIKKILKEEGYSAACTSITGFNDNKSDLLELKRIEIRSNDSLGDFKNKLRGCYNWLGYFQKMKLKFQNQYR